MMMMIMIVGLLNFHKDELDSATQVFNEVLQKDESQLAAIMGKVKQKTNKKRRPTKSSS